MSYLKSIAAVLAGFLVVVLLSIGSDTILEASGFFPQPGEVLSSKYLVIALIYRCIYTVAGGYVAALLAPGNKMKHVHVLAVIGTLGGIAGVFAGWNLSAHWYPIAIAVTAYPLVYWGGKLYTKNK